MKNLIKFVLISTSILLIGCRPEIKSIGTYYPSGDGLIGNWTFKTVKQTDVSVPIYEEKDVTHFYDSYPTHWKVTINSDSTYMVNEKGAGPDLLGDNGTWTFTNYPFPEGFVLFSTSDTVSVAFKTMPRANDITCTIDIEREACDGPAVIYNIELIRN